jgi:hypothetical protein
VASRRNIPVLGHVGVEESDWLETHEYHPVRTKSIIILHDWEAERTLTYNGDGWNVQQGHDDGC